jgi:hypothetical protein
MPESHTGKNIAERLNEVVIEFQIKINSKQSLFGITEENMWGTTDGAPNIKKAMEIFGGNHLICFAHILNNSLIKSIKPFILLVEKCRIIVKFFKLSPKNTNLLYEMDEKLKIPKRKLKLDAVTR